MSSKVIKLARIGNHLTMKTILLIVALTAFQLANAQMNYSKVKIFTDNAGLQTLAELGLAVDHGERKQNTFFIGDLSESDIQILNENGFNYEIVVEDVKAYYANQNLLSAKNITCSSDNAQLPEVPANFYMNSTYAGFYRYQDMLDALDSMAAAYPSLITTRVPISNFQTHEGRPIFFVKISDDPNTDDAAEPNTLYTAIHHAREPMSMSQTIFYMWYLLENYATDPEIQYLVDNTELFFVPCINPDGYIHNESNDPNGFGMHRKNKAPVGTNNPGVDLNRNYSYGWNTTGVSPNVNNDTYPGTSAFSEPETQAIKWMVENYGFKSAMNAHSYGDLLLFPVGTTVAEFADHHDYFQDLSSHMAQYNLYVAQKSSGLYAASGDSDDYMYKDSIGTGPIVKDTIFVMTPEVGSDFWPSQAEVEPTCAEMVFPNLTMAHITHTYLAVKETDPILIPNSSGFFHHEVQRLGFESNPVTVSIIPITNIQSVGAPITYDISWNSKDDDSISFVLNPVATYGDEIKYVLVTDYGPWQNHDTIVKTFDQWQVLVSQNGSSAANWTGNWSITSDDSYSPATSFTDSDGGDYNDDDDKSWEYTDMIDLTYAMGAMVTFYAKWEIEADYDYCQFQVSTNGGTTWEGQCGLYTTEGSSTGWNGSVQPNGEPVWEGASDWVQERISLSDYLGEMIRVRFRFESDGGVNQDGFYFDDFEVSANFPIGLVEENLLPLTLAPNPANTSFLLSSPYQMTGSVIVRDQSGKIVLEQIITSGSKQTTVSTANLSNGIYYVSLDGSSSNQNPVKLVVMK